jgi:hypothetical protein
MPPRSQAVTTSSTPTTAKTTSTRKSNEDIDPTYFDRFLKSTSEMPWSTTDNPFSSSMSDDLNFTDVDIENFNATDIKTLIFDQNSQDNDLENTTEYRNDVEEMFDDSHENANRTKRQAYPQYERKTLLISCHNAGGFTSARQRWWYIGNGCGCFSCCKIKTDFSPIALANCGSNKGMDVRFKFKMTNGPPGDFWHEHFSADEMCKFYF